MKPQMILSLLAALMISCSVYATPDRVQKDGLQDENAQTAINLHRNDVVVVHVLKKPEQLVGIRICDNNGIVLKKNRLKKDNQVKMSYDISAFPDGDYCFEITQNGAVIARKVVTKGATPDTELPKIFNGDLDSVAKKQSNP